MSKAKLPDIPWEKRPGGERSLEMQRAGMVVDLRRCIGCHACSVSCKTEHTVALGAFRTRVRYLQRPDAPRLAFVPVLCMHCADAPCLGACPSQAVVRLADGRITIDQDRCNADGSCAAACPYDAIYVDESAGRADNCDLCTHRTTLGMEPACVNACPTEALRFGDLGDADSEVSRYAAANDAKPLRAKAGTSPSVLYVGHEPWMDGVDASGVQLSDDDDEIIYERR